MGIAKTNPHAVGAPEPAVKTLMVQRKNSRNSDDENRVHLASVTAEKIKPRNPEPSQSPANVQRDISHIEKLLALEAQVRETASLKELQYLIANETLKLVSASQIIVHGPASNNKTGKIEIISSVTQIDPQSPTVVWLNKEISGLRNRADAHVEGNLKSYSFRLRNNTAPHENYPFAEAHHVPLASRISEGSGNSLGAVTYLKNGKFSGHDLATIQRLSGTFSHGWASFVPRLSLFRRLVNRRVLAVAALILIILGFLPVPMTVLAPIEVVARSPKVIAAPLNGVIEKVWVKPGDLVRKGDKLVSYVKTDIEANAEVARQRVQVASARYIKASQEAFGTGAGKRDLLISKAELELSEAEYQYAVEKFKMTEITAPSSGVLLFLSVDHWTGRPVSAGERIMRIANPDETQLKIDLSVNDSIILRDNAGINIFLDFDPLNARSAKMTSRNFEATLTERDTLAFELLADLEDDHDSANREKLAIGLRGTAQIYGEKVSLGFFLFRKPISTIRQFIGI